MSQHASASTAFSSYPELPLLFLELSRNTDNMFSISFRKFCHNNKKVLLFNHQKVNYLCLCHHYFYSSWMLVLFLLSFRPISACNMHIFFGLFSTYNFYINIIKSMSQDHARTCFWLIKEHSRRWPFHTHHMYLYHMHFFKYMYMNQYRVYLYFHSLLV